MTPNPPKALHGLRVLDFSRILAGPYCTMLLGDFGAEIIKVERPGSGDDTRQWGPPWVGSGAERQSAYFLSINRNKYSITLDLQKPEAQAVARRLAEISDVVVENFRVGQMQRYGLDYAALSQLNPGLVYCSITGYGQDSPYADHPGYDFVIQGQSGLMSITGPADGPPYKVGVAISDVITGLTAANAIQSALLYRQQTGQGQYIDIALLDSQLAALVNIASSYLVSHTPPARYGNAHPSIVPYEVFEAADRSFILAVGNDDQFRKLCHLIRRPELSQNPRFQTNPARVTNRTELVGLLQPIFKEQPSQAWIDACHSAGIPAGPISDIPTALHNPHVQARGLLHEIDSPNLPPFVSIGPAARLSVTPPGISQPPPTLGQHTWQILHNLLHLDDVTLADYAQRRII